MLKIPEEERPRERLIREGVDALSLSELLAIILGSGTMGKTVIELASEVLERFGSLEALLEASLVELMEIKGIGQAKAIQLKAVFGIALKCRKPASLRKLFIQSPEEAYQLAKGEIAHQPHEVLMVILRDVRGKLIHREHVSSGTLSQVLAHPREIFFPAVRYKAHSMIIAHNHPSGDPTPSKSDLELTRCLIQSGKVMGIPLDDHLIVCKDRYLSMRKEGWMGEKCSY
jgi:DNA repair protein RadC